jgi:hypothetical protein
MTRLFISRGAVPALRHKSCKNSSLRKELQFRNTLPGGPCQSGRPRLKIGVEDFTCVITLVCFLLQRCSLSGLPRLQERRRFRSRLR